MLRGDAPWPLRGGNFACSESAPWLGLKSTSWPKLIERSFRVPDINWNKTTWGSTYAWPGGGEEWSVAWGGSEAQWFGAIYPRLHRFLPAKRILEIAPGFGRWTNYLLPACDELVGVDLSAKCIDACRQRFAAAKHASFFNNDGYSLAAAPDRQFDLIFSFDSLVHADYDVLAAYIPEILRKLSAGGVAFIHHSNLLAYGAAINTVGEIHGRAVTVSADIVANLIDRAGGTILIQEVVNWGGEHLIDCLTLFGHRDSYPAAKAVHLKNPLFMGESTLIKNFQSPYSMLARAPAAMDQRLSA
jgi:SAM-dependent methyltransferase